MGISDSRGAEQPKLTNVVMEIISKIMRYQYCDDYMLI